MAKPSTAAVAASDLVLRNSGIEPAHGSRPADVSTIRLPPRAVFSAQALTAFEEAISRAVARGRLRPRDYGVRSVDGVVSIFRDAYRLTGTTRVTVNKWAGTVWEVAAERHPDVWSAVMRFVEGHLSHVNEAVRRPPAHLAWMSLLHDPIHASDRYTAQEPVLVTREFLDPVLVRNVRIAWPRVRDGSYGRGREFSDAAVLTRNGAGQVLISHVEFKSSVGTGRALFDQMAEKDRRLLDPRVDRDAVLLFEVEGRIDHVRIADLVFPRDRTTPLLRPPEDAWARIGVVAGDRLRITPSVGDAAAGTYVRVEAPFPVAATREIVTRLLADPSWRALAGSP